MIDHFTDFLLVSLNDQLLLPLMVSHGLLTDHDLELINSGPTGYHKNQLILTCVQILDDASLVVFSRLLQDSHPDVKIPLQDGEYTCVNFICLSQMYQIYQKVRTLQHRKDCITF